MDFFWLGLGIAVFGYFVGEGLKNFQNPTDVGSILDSNEAYENHKLVKQSDLHWYIGVSKEDAKKLVEEHPDIPYIKLNGQVYYPRKRLREWLLDFGK